MAKNSKTEDADNVKALLGRTFGAVIFSLLPGGGGYETVVISGRDHETEDEDYELIGLCAEGACALIDTLSPLDLLTIHETVANGGSIDAGISMSDHDEEGPMSLDSLFHAKPAGRA